MQDLIHDRGRGPELVGTRITVYNLLPDFLDPSLTEATICRRYNLQPEQVAAARAYILNHPETVLAEHLRIEEKIAAGNPPAVMEQAKQTHELFLRFRKHIAEQQHPADEADGQSSATTQAFREWLAQQETEASGRS